MQFWYKYLGFLFIGVLLLMVSCASVIVESIRINEGDQVIEVDGTVQLTVDFTFKKAEDNVPENKNVTWESDNDTVATVDASGIVTGKAVGTAKITATSEKDSKTDTINITVEDKGIVASIEIAGGDQSIEVDGTVQLTVDFTFNDPADDIPANKNVTWESDNDTVATVDASGIVTGKAIGEANITATSEKDSKTDTIKITVTDKGIVASIEIAGGDQSIEVNGTVQLTVDFTFNDPADDIPANKNVTWESDDEAVATVDASGLVTGKAIGEANITATSEKDSRTDTIKVTVTDKAFVFIVTIENVSTNSTLTLPDNSTISVPLSPGVWVVHSDSDKPLFTSNAPDSGDGLEALAEDGDPSTLGNSVDGQFKSSGVFNTPVGAVDPAPIGPGEKYEFEIMAVPGDRLSLATMFVESNDLFYAYATNGIALFNADNTPKNGSLAGFRLRDAGTEANQPEGVGDNQPPRQGPANTGPVDPNDKIREVEGTIEEPNTTGKIMSVSLAQK